jgi:hypothetical protein
LSYVLKDGVQVHGSQHGAYTKAQVLLSDATVAVARHTQLESSQGMFSHSMQSTEVLCDDMHPPAKRKGCRKAILQQQDSAAGQSWWTDQDNQHLFASQQQHSP